VLMHPGYRAGPVLPSDGSMEPQATPTPGMIEAVRSELARRRPEPTTTSSTAPPSEMW
jgi:hypothetical protein